MLQVTQQLALGKVMYNLEVQEKIASHRQVKIHKYKYWHMFLAQMYKY
jgi:hypothetical protein